MATNVKRASFIFCIAVLFIGASLPLTALALSPAALPPPPPPPPTTTPTPTPQVAKGAEIELLVQPAYEAMWQTYFWQDLWTVVQWQDLEGLWHDVAGWRGTPDEIVDGAARKTWWVAEDDLAKGPFRWVVYQNQDGPILSTSEPFYLPAACEQAAAVKVTLGP